MTDRLTELIQLINGLESIAIAFSGGVDSSFLAAVAHIRCKTPATAITAITEFQTEREYYHAIDMAKHIGIRHALVKVEVLKNKKIVRNQKDRCYFCKKTIFAALIDYAEHSGIKNIAHGANLNDLNDFRPGFKAAQEMGILSPLIVAGMNKNSIRQCSKKMNLKTWNMYSQSCLATRIPYHSIINSEKLLMIEKSENYLSDLGFTGFRVRCHGKIARIELEPESIKRFGQKQLRDKIVKKFKKIGFLYISIDLEGYIPGSMNRVIT